METTMSRKHIYPRANPQKEPTPWWYFGRAVYVSRYDYKKIFFIFLKFNFYFFNTFSIVFEVSSAFF